MLCFKTKSSSYCLEQSEGPKIWIFLGWSQTQVVLRWLSMVMSSLSTQLTCQIILSLNRDGSRGNNTASRSSNK